MTQPMWRNVIGPISAAWSPANVPIVRIWKSHQTFHACSDITGNTTFW